MSKSQPLKANLHPRNQHNNGYDFPALVQTLGQLSAFVSKNPHQQDTIDFSDPQAVKMLNKALLMHHYGIEFWDIPENYLCPPIPGRVDYLHYLADLLALDNNGIIPTGKKVSVLDIGTGANLVYPLTGQSEYGWQFVGSDIDPVSLKVAKQISQFNKLPIKLRAQKSANNIFHSVINEKDLFCLTLCNPPFHSSPEQALQGTQRKWQNLGHTAKNNLNFGGQNAELWCEGGELAFIKTMMSESADYQDQVVWFSSLVSKKEHVAPLQKHLARYPVAEVKVVEMAQGQKVSRFIAWSYFNSEERNDILTEMA